jgi:hypothetical protein
MANYRISKQTLRPCLRCIRTNFNLFMLQFINDLPENIVGIHAVGEVTKEDIDTVLIPRLDDLVKRQAKSITCWYWKQMRKTLPLVLGLMM